MTGHLNHEASTSAATEITGPMSLAHAMALRIHALGIVPVRLPFKAKHLYRKGWTSERPTPEEIRNWRLPFNIGALCGSASGDYCDVDVDCDEGIALAPHYLRPTWVHGRVGRPRSHWHYFAKGVRYHKIHDPNDNKVIIELRGEATTGSAVMSVWPYSTHVKGELIEWDPEYGDGMEAPLTVDGPELVTAVCKLARAIIIMRAGATLEEAIEIERSYKPAPPERKSPKRVTPETTTTVKKGAVCFTCGIVAESDSGWVTKSTCSLACVRVRARKYVEKMPAAISGSGGHDTTFRVAVALVRGFALDEDDAIEILTDYNQRCDPPWSSADLKRKAKEAAKAKKVTHGCLLREKT